MFRARTKVSGFRELAASLRELADATRVRVMRRAVRVAAKPVEEHAKRIAPVLKVPDKRRRPGALRDAIVTRAMPQEGSDLVAAKVTVRRAGRAARRTPDDVFYARMVEMGTSKTKAQPFLRPALYGEQRRVIDIMRAELRVGVEREARRVARARRRQLRASVAAAYED